MINQWNLYSKKYKYANHIEFNIIVHLVKALILKLNIV
mgnify:CR=1 FL=1